MRTQIHHRLAPYMPTIAMLVTLLPAIAWSQASWVGDVLIDGEPSNLWARCNPCGGGEDPPNTNWSTDRIPGDDDPFLGDPGSGAVIGPDFVVDHNGGTLDLSTLDVQGGLIVGGLINISDSATINNIDLESGGALAGAGPVTLTGSGTWNGFLRSGGGVTNEAILTAVTGDLETDLVNNRVLNIFPSLDFTSTPSLLTNNGTINLDPFASPFGSSDILDGSGAANLLINNAFIDMFGPGLSVIEVPGIHAGGTIRAGNGTLRFFRGNWQFSGGRMEVSNNAGFSDSGHIELTGNVNHVINGTSGITGQGSLLVNMNTFGTLMVTQPFAVDLGGSGEHGLLLQGIGINLEAALTNRQGGRWSIGTISAAGAGRLINESPLSDPFRIVSGGTKVLNGDMDSMGWIEQSSTVRVNAPRRLSIASGGGLKILADPSSIDWSGDGEVVNAGEVEVQSDARSTMAAGFSQADGGQLRSEGELRLRGGGSWSGATLTILAGQGYSVPAVSFENDRFDFVSGTHDFVDLDSAPGVQELELKDAELIAAADATVIFNLDEGEAFFGQIDQAGRVVLIGSGLGGAGRFENRGHFHWQSGELGIDGIIEFVNTANGRILISNSGNLLDGRLQNQGEVIGGIRLTSDAVVENSGTWVLLDQVIGTSDTSMLGTFENAGVLQVQSISGAESRIDARLDNPGTVTVFGGSTLRINGPVAQLQNGVLVGGTWQLGPGALLVIPEPFQTIGPGTVVRGLENVENIEALAHILGGEASVTGNLSLDGGLELGNGARITVDGQSSVNVPGGVQNGAPGQNGSITEMLEEVIVIDQVPEPPDARTSALASGGKPAARGAQVPLLTTPLFDNHAVIAPGGLGLPGPFKLDGDLVMHPGSTLDIDITGATPLTAYDQLAVTGSAELGGTIEITVAEEFTPAIGQQFVIATAAATSGAFAGINQTNRKDIFWSLTENVNEVILTVADLGIFADRFE